MVTSFPFGNELINSAFLFFRGSSQSLIKLIPLIFIIRLVIIKATLGGARDYGELLRELLFLYVGFFMFSEIMELVMKAPEVAESILKKDNPPILDSTNQSGGILYYFYNINETELMKLLSSLVYWVVCFCYLIIMFFMISIGAYIILFSTMFKMRWMIGAYFTFAMILSLWPFIWYSIDQAFIFTINSLKNSGSSLASIVALIVGCLLKLSVPIIGAFAAMKVPLSLGTSLKESVKEGSKPVFGLSKASGTAVSKLGNKLGFSQAVEPFRKDPVKQELRRKDKEKEQKFNLNKTLPLASYGIQKLTNSLKSNKNIESLNKHKNFDEFYNHIKKRSIQRDVINIDKKTSSQKNLSEYQRNSLNVRQERNLESLDKINLKTSTRSNDFKEVKKSVISKHESKNSKLNDNRFLKSIETNQTYYKKELKKNFNNQEFRK